MEKYLSERLDTIMTRVITPSLRFMKIREIRQEWYRRMHKNLLGQIVQQFPVIEENNLVETFWNELEKQLERDIQRVLIQPGECVGVTCAQSIGERQTQLTLNSFHSAGLSVQTVVTGVPRFLELLNATKELKCTSNRFQLKTNTLNTPASIRRLLGYSIVHLTLRKIVEEIQTVSCSKEQQTHTNIPWWWSHYFTVYAPHRIHLLDHDMYGCTLKCRKDVLYRYRIPLSLIKTKIETIFHDVVVIFSPLYMGEITIFFPVQCATSTQSTLHHDLWYDFLQSNTRHTFNSHEFLLQRFIEDIFWSKLSDLTIVGIPGIQKMYIQKIPGTSPSTYQVETVGNGFISLASHPHVKFSSLQTNQIWDVFSVLGIEACRKFLIDEFTQIVSSDGSFVHTSHLHLLVDMMTRHGTITSISRYGMKKETTGPLSRASFEEVMDHFLQASLFQEKEDLRGVSASIICGQRSVIGTGLCQLRMASPFSNTK